MKHFFIFTLCLITCFSAKSQCANLTPYGTITAPTSGTDTISTCSYQEEYSAIDAVLAATIYQCEILSGGYITIREGSPNGPVVTSGVSPLTWTSTVAGTYYAHWNTDANCGTATTCQITTVTYVSPAFPCSGVPAPGNTICSAGNTVCSNISFNLSLQSPMLGSGITYQWHSSIDGVTYTPISGANAATYSTAISSATYFYCSEDCSGSSTNSTPISLTIAPFNQCYCTPVYSIGTNSGDLISEIEISGTTLSNNTGFVAGVPSYNYFTGQPNYTATLLPSASYSLFVATGEYGSQGYAAWIDYNDDGIFAISERIGYTNGTIGQGWTQGQVNDSSTFVISLSCSPPSGLHRMRIRGVYFVDGDQIDPCLQYNYGETEDYDITIASPPACPSAGLVVSTSTTQNTANVSWLLTCSSANIYDFEYGPTGFIPGTGTFLNNQTVTIVGDTASFMFTGLADNIDYTFYYRANCGNDSSLWSAANNFTTLCSSITALGWCENFDSDSQTEQCWTILNANNDGSSWNTNTAFNQLTGDNCASINTDFNNGNNNDWLITPKLTLIGTEILKFNYRVNSEFEPNDLKVKISTTGMNPADFTTTLMSLDSIANTTYQDTSINLSTYTGNVYIAFNIPQGGLDGWLLFLDQICITECVQANIADDSLEICQTADTLDLTTVLNIGQSQGNWSLISNPSALSGSTLYLDSLTTGVYGVNYLVNDACQSTAALATILMYEPSNAGIDSAVILCKGQPFDLFDALTGNFQTGGTWYDPNNQMLTSSFIVTGNFPGQFNYDYIMTNGVCPSDSSNALLIVNNCVYVGIDELNQASVTIYPNPANELLNIDWNGKVETIFVMDASGRVLSKFNLAPELHSFNFSLNNIEKGAYWLVLENGNSRIVKPWIKN
jgi:hypothetical protein